MLKTRTLTATILAITVGLFLFMANTTVWQFLVLIATLVAAWEWAGFVPKLQLNQKVQFSLLVVVTVWFSFSMLSFSAILVLTLVSAFWMFFAVVRYQITQGKAVIQNPIWILLLGILSILLFANVLFAFREVFGPTLFLLSLFVIWAVDTGAYFSGRRFGRYKLAVFVSPGKTWEGVVGGAVLSYVVALIGLIWLEPSIHISYGLMALGMALIGLFSVVGDLYESLLKRQAGLKDSGKIFPGHGGMLDRIDSLIIAIPMFYVLWFWVQV